MPPDPENPESIADDLNNLTKAEEIKSDRVFFV